MPKKQKNSRKGPKRMNIRKERVPKRMKIRMGEKKWRVKRKKRSAAPKVKKCLNGLTWPPRARSLMPSSIPPTTPKDVRQLVTAERHFPPKCTNFGFFTTKVYEFWVFYHQSVRILIFLLPKCTNFVFFTTKVYEF